jgi:hypothetical protein
MNQKPIILLDLNYTLVGNSDDPANKIPYPGRIIKQTYRRWLIDMIRDYRVFIITARDAKYKEATLADLQAKEGWLPERSYWNDFNQRPPDCKERILHSFIFTEFGRGVPVGEADLFGSPSGFKSPYFAIESNPRTRAMYAKYKIPAAPCEELQSGRVRIR